MAGACGKSLPGIAVVGLLPPQEEDAGQQSAGFEDNRVSLAEKKERATSGALS